MIFGHYISPIMFIEAFDKFMMQDDEQRETTHEKTTDWFYSSGGKLLARFLTYVHMFCFRYDVHICVWFLRVKYFEDEYQKQNSSHV